ncbi:hypothetical protein BDP55DRAFT_660634 [Colletotrichum godetiae]|uniref:Uncharacterized protein n=1 Tax=Colletotrichum godetiae TaxID=1209918 RepID=A0AAJ0ANZ7_9PEZI|nr:uncharacterized protein BDP55DRAFT_660634 [Colletotrichum godetiae]KAK1676745.1 hypothetical protein BDP55DRAFT_660634 [Colletotrichum godetiae]
MMFRRSIRVDDITAPLSWSEKEMGWGWVDLISCLEWDWNIYPMARSVPPWYGGEF